MQILSQIENNPPNSPEQLMQYMAQVLTLMYDGTITEDLLLTEVIRIQRLLFATEMLESNTFDEQHAQFMQDLNRNRDRQEFQTKIEVVHLEETAPGFFTAHVAQRVQHIGIIHWAYYIIYENGWRVESFFMADDQFTPFRIIF
jgi:hypothetical protein